MLPLVFFLNLIYYYYYYSDFQEFTLESRTQKMSNYVDLEQIFGPKEAHSRVQCQSMKP